MYSVCYSPDGNPNSIKRETEIISFIPLDEENHNFAAFLVWNSQQSEPLDWETPIPPVAEDTVFQFDKAIQAPNFLVATPKINPDPEKALDEAIAEMENGEGAEKSVALIALSLAKYLESKREKLK